MDGRKLKAQHPWKFPVIAHQHEETTDWDQNAGYSFGYRTFGRLVAKQCTTMVNSADSTSETRHGPLNYLHGQPNPAQSSTNEEEKREAILVTVDESASRKRPTVKLGDPSIAEDKSPRPPEVSVRWFSEENLTLHLYLLPVSERYASFELGTNMGGALCCIQVEQSTVAIKEGFGKFDDVLQPGCHCLPWFLGSQLAGHLSLRVQQLDVKCETKTKDNVFVNAVASVQYRALAEKASDAFYKLSNTKGQIQALIRASVPKLNVDDAFEQKNDIAKAVEVELEKAMSAYGYEIVQTLIVDIEPDQHVNRAMNEINAAARLRVAANEKAEAEKIIQIKKAEGEAEAKYLTGLGIARQRQAIVDGLRDSVLGFSENVPGTSAKDVMDMVLVTQYFDTMKEMGLAPSVMSPHRFVKDSSRLLQPIDRLPATSSSNW
ncbi:hypothetical protein SAY86_015998 [Trapa natans]|uniref:Band 7 domain-containing protein n=1 Tax=Trapa natans TaxID=22666 RepID=A0AAN7LJI2_TRANT|nr:hypothetical protein SAY86_015998 [Trapa natans]